jgi:hypothetical protein
MLLLEPEGAGEEIMQGEIIVEGGDVVRGEAVVRSFGSTWAILLTL